MLKFQPSWFLSSLLASIYNILSLARHNVYRYTSTLVERMHRLCNCEEVEDQVLFLLICPTHYILELKCLSLCSSRPKLLLLFTTSQDQIYFTLVTSTVHLLTQYSTLQLVFHSLTPKVVCSSQHPPQLVILYPCVTITYFFTYSMSFCTIPHKPSPHAQYSHLVCVSS